jgi:hypothetical protein
LIESGRRTLFAKQIVKKIFACADHSGARATNAKLNTRVCGFCCCSQRGRAVVVTKRPYFIGCFAMSAAWYRCALRNVAKYRCAARMLREYLRAVSQATRASARASRVTVFFILLV